jgi:isoleucyl-tRNA synthetase
LQNHENALQELFGVSGVDLAELKHLRGPNVEGNDILFNVHIATAPKCERCWRHVPDVGDNANYPTVCLRCAEALDAIDFPPYPATPAQNEQRTT